MIFATLGTLHFPFERLVRALAVLPGDEEVVVQTRVPVGEPGRLRVVADLPYDELLEHVRRGRAVVCHAGVGSILTVLGEGKRPVVVPRLARFGEAVDDHQLPFARRLADAGLVTLVEDAAALPEALAAEPAAVAPLGERGGRLADDLRRTLERLVYSR